MLYNHTSETADDKYQELTAYVYHAAKSIAERSLSRYIPHRTERVLDLAEQIRHLVREARLMDREISIDAQEEWKKKVIT